MNEIPPDPYDNECFDQKWNKQINKMSLKPINKISPCALYYQLAHRSLHTPHRQINWHGHDKIKVDHLSRIIY